MERFKQGDVTVDVLIFGGSGMIGQALAEAVVAHQDNAWIFTRSGQLQAHGTAVSYSLSTLARDIDQLGLSDPYAIVNLAGESISKGRWTAERKREIHDSRVALTRELANVIPRLKVPPSVFVSGSAIGYYGSSTSDTFVESSRPGKGFLPDVTLDWEIAAQAAAQFTRVVLLRTGVVLSKEGGALPPMVQPYRLYVGGRIGNGRQWVSWIHLADVVGIILYSIRNADVNGPVNVTAPHPVQMDEMGRAIATVLRRPHWIPVPTLAMQLLFGEMSEIILQGQRVLPNAMLEAGYIFEHPELEDALRDILVRSR